MLLTIKATLISWHISWLVSGRFFQLNRQEGNIMNRSKKAQAALLVLVSLLIVVAAGAGFRLYNQKVNELNSLQSQTKDVDQALKERDSMVNELVTAMNDIEDNLKFIKDKRQQLSIETQKEGGRDQKQAIIDDINLMNEMLEKSSKHINELEKKLKNSGFELRALKKKITSLNQSIEEQNVQIAELHSNLEEKDMLITGMNLQMDTMKMEIAQKRDTLQIYQQKIDQNINDINKAYIAYGTYKELNGKGLLRKEGGFLGIGKHTSLTKNFDYDYFTELDIRDTENIPLFAPKAKVITEHPDSSYSFVEEDGQIAYLHIDNPDEFWRISKYAVIELK